MDKLRRQFILKASLLLGTSTVIALSSPTLALNMFLSKKDYYQTFISTSILLTGKNHLSTDLLQQYFEVLYHQSNNNDFLSLLEKVRHLHTNPDQLKHELSLQLRQQTPIGIEIKKIIYLWYFGQVNDKTVSDLAYQRALVWPAFHTTAPGISAGNQWNHQPPLLIA